MPISEPTAVFSIRDDRDMEIKQAVLQVYRALEEKGYNPINQLVGYILSEDPTYITTYKNARALIRKVDRRSALLLRRTASMHAPTPAAKTSSTSSKRTSPAASSST